MVGFFNTQLLTMLGYTSKCAITNYLSLATAYPGSKMSLFNSKHYIKYLSPSNCHLYPYLLKVSNVWELLACKNSHLSSLLCRQPQKFYIDDVKSVRNLVRSSDWLTQQLHCFSYCLQMTDKRQKATKVKCKCDESTNSQYSWNIFLFTRSIILSFVGACLQKNTKLY